MLWMISMDEVGSGKCSLTPFFGLQMVNGTEAQTLLLPSTSSVTSVASVVKVFYGELGPGKTKTENNPLSKLNH